MYVVYHSSDSFVGVTCVSIASLLENNKDMDKIEIFYISKGISEENKKIVTDLNVKGQKVLMRVDFNVPMKDGKITDENRIVAALPTIKYVLENGGRVIAFSHLGKVKTEEDLAKKSLRPVAERLAELLGQPVKFIPATRGAELEAAVAELKDGEIMMFENTRFEDLDGKKESKNDPELGKYWASLGDLFVNDAFGTAHRAHASNVGIAAFLPAH